MTPINLISALAGELREVVKDYKLIAENQPPKRVTVYEQYLPTYDFEDDTFFPLITVSLATLECEFEESVATVILTVGTFGGNKEDGWRDMLNLAERVRQFILTTPILANKFILKAPVVFEPLPKQPDPFYYGRIAARYIVGTPRVSITK